jgi:hypothetical protein
MTTLLLSCLASRTKNLFTWRVGNVHHLVHPLLALLVQRNLMQSPEITIFVSFYEVQNIDKATGYTGFGYTDQVTNYCNFWAMKCLKHVQKTCL